MLKGTTMSFKLLPYLPLHLLQQEPSFFFGYIFSYQLAFQQPLSFCSVIFVKYLVRATIICLHQRGTALPQCFSLFQSWEIWDKMFLGKREVRVSNWPTSPLKIGIQWYTIDWVGGDISQRITRTKASINTSSQMEEMAYIIIYTLIWKPKHIHQANHLTWASPLNHPKHHHIELLVIVGKS